MSGNLETDCETYDCIEEWMESKPTGLLATLLPHRVYRILFGPQPPDPDAVTTRREQVQQTYREIIDKYRSVCRDSSSDAEEVETTLPDWKRGTDFKLYTIDEVFHLPTPSDDGVDLQDYLVTLDTTAERVQDLHSDVEQLTVSDNHRYLRESEQERLTALQQALTNHSQAIEAEWKRTQATDRLGRPVGA